MFILPGQEISLDIITEKNALSLKKFKNKFNKKLSIIELQLNNSISINLYEDKELCFSSLNILYKENKIINDETYNFINQLNQNNKLHICYIEPKDVLSLSNNGNLSLFDIEQNKVISLIIEKQIFILLQTHESIESSLHLAKQIIISLSKSLIKYNIIILNMENDIIKQQLLNIKKWYYLFLRNLFNEYVINIRDNKAIKKLLSDLTNIWVTLIFEFYLEPDKFITNKKKILFTICNIPKKILTFMTTTKKEKFKSSNKSKFINTNFEFNDDNQKFLYALKITKFRDEFLIPLISLFENDMLESAVLYSNLEYEKLIELISNTYKQFKNNNSINLFNPSIGKELLFAHVLIDILIDDDESLNIINQNQLKI